MRYPVVIIAAIAAAAVVAVASAQEHRTPPVPDAVKARENAGKPPELTEVRGRLVYAEDMPATGGLAYFVFQNRINEIPHTNPEQAVRDKAEYVVGVDKDGSFTLEMAPGNYAMFYDPSATASPESLKPGPDSMAAVQKRDPDRVKAHIAAIKENAQKGLPIVEGMLGDQMFVVENRIVRPPLSDFGQMVLLQDNSVTVLALNEAGNPIDFPAVLKIRGKSGDVYEPHNPTLNTPGQFVFHDVFPQMYTVVALATRPKPGEGDEPTTPTVKNAQFVFETGPMLHEVTVIPGKSGN
jgi:hypothetical protein